MDPIALLARHELTMGPFPSESVMYPEVYMMLLCVHSHCTILPYGSDVPIPYGLVSAKERC